MEVVMNYRLKKYFIIIFLISLFIPLLLVSGFHEIKIDAGANQFANWEKTGAIQLKGSVSPGGISCRWSCPANPQVHFHNAAEPTTKVTFPRPGYYLLELAAWESDNKKASDTVIINVFKPNSYDDRLSDLVGLMTVDEKIGQLIARTDAIPSLGISKYNYWNEALHGVKATGATSFPQVVALGSTWDPDLVHRVATAISDEARVKNKIEGKGLTYWSPTVNIARDPRWGRNEESYSEDPYLLSQMGIAFVTGMQGDHPFYLKTVSTPKHFIANNEEARRHSGSSEVDMRSLWEYYMPAFQQTIVFGKAFSIMCAYNELNQEPCCGNYYLLKDVLRDKWGFEGYVVSDCGAINDMVYGHHYFETEAEAAARAILAGCDLNCGYYYILYLHEALEGGLIEEKDIDRALKRVLSARFRLGEFDPQEIVPYSGIPEEKLDCKEHRDLALESARKSIVLLKNDGILPLDKNKIKSIAVIGPNAEECQLGIYSGSPNIQISPLEGIKNKASSYGIEVNYVRGSGFGGSFTKPIETKYFGQIGDSGQKGMLGQYFDNIELKGDPVLTRIDSVIDFEWYMGPPAPELPGDQFSVRWTGEIIPPVTDVFSLETRTDDGARLYLDGQLLFEDWTTHGEKPNRAEVELEAGKSYKIVYEYFESGLGAVARLTWNLCLKDFDKAKEIAQVSDVVVFVLGTHPNISEEENDRMDIALPQIQQDLVKEIAQLNPNVVIVLINGGPLALEDTEKDASAILEAWYTGQASGTAIADVLFGVFNPGGKLPETFYASNDQLPPFDNYNVINNGRTYMYFEGPVLYPFGHGLSYTTFDYSNLKLSAEEITREDAIKIECVVKNTGRYKGDEVVQVYVHDIKASVKVPIRQLKRFKRVTLKPGESKTVSFDLPAPELSFYDIKSNDFIVEPGEFEVQIGSSSEDIRLRKKFIVE
jgi:beta-glucosidase